jgi:hypothetical protein
VQQWASDSEARLNQKPSVPAEGFCLSGLVQIIFALGC